MSAQPGRRSPPPPSPRRLAPHQWLVLVVCTALSLSAAVAIAAGMAEELLRSGGIDAPVLTVPLVLLWVGGVALIGLLLAVRRPENRVSWLFVVLGPLLGFISGVWSYRWTAPPGFEYLFEWSSLVASWLVVMLAGPGLALVFPDGRLPSRRWRRPVIGVAATFLASLVLLHLAPGQLHELAGPDTVVSSDPGAGVAALEPWADPLALSMYGGIMALGALGIAAVVHRRRTGTAEVRAQLSWFLLAVGLIPLGILVSMVESVVTADGGAIVGPTLLFCGFGLTPVAVAIAILRYRLFDIDIVIRRTLVYGTLVVVLGAVYATSVVVLQAVVVSVTGGQGLAVAGATLLVAAAFSPVRSRVQRAVDRRFFRSRRDAGQLLAWLSTRLRDQLELDSGARDLARVADAGFRPSHVSVWIRPRMDGR